MILKIIVLLNLIFNVKLQYIKQDGGTYSLFDITVDPNFICITGSSFIRSIQFSGTFFLVPQIAITSISTKFDSNVYYSFDFLSYSTTGFQIYFQCKSSAQLYKYVFSWLAFDDQRIMVINNWVVSPIPQQKSQFWLYTLQGYTLEYSTQVLNFGRTIEISLDTDALHQQQHIQFTVINNLGVGNIFVQIVVGPDFLIKKRALTFDINAPSQTTQNVNVGSTNFTIIGLQYQDNSEALNEVSIDYSAQCVGTASIIYEYQGGSQVYNYYLVDFFGVQSYKPLQLKNMRVSKMLSISLNTNIIWQLNFVKNYNFTQPESRSYQNYLDNPYLIFSYECQPSTRIIGNLLKCSSCAVNKQYQSFAQNCYQKLNLITFYINFYQDSQAFSTLTFKVTNQGFVITQTIQLRSDLTTQGTYTIMNLQVL